MNAFPQELSYARGIGYRRELAHELLRAPGAVDFVEVVAETCFADAPARREAVALSEIWPVVPHGVNLSLGSAKGIDTARARRLGDLSRALRAPVVTEHVALTSAAGRDIGHLTPVPRCAEIVRAVARNVRGNWVVLGDGKLELPLVYIDDVVDAIAAAIDKKLTGGEVIHLIDPEHLTQQEVLDLAGDKKRVVRVPRRLVFALGKLSEIVRLAGKQSPIGTYRLESALARLHYESDLAKKLLDWRPRVGVREGIRRVNTPKSPEVRAAG